jgi:repressor LexA
MNNSIAVHSHTDLINIYNNECNNYSESIINTGIYNGDHVIVKKCNTAENSDIVVALIDDSATVKRFYKEDGHIRLQPENDFMDPIIVDDCSIVGKVIGLIRWQVD